ncbi:MAG: hypothetical protein GX946_00480 [Oligosphaeraceae bacterium]|nr:hypothetical protein [Oligosphaeraceae bacterium]
MKISKLYRSLKQAVLGFIFLFIAFFLHTSLYELNAERKIEKTLASLPNYNYIPEIRRLKQAGKLNEAIEMTRFVLQHPDMPGQSEAKELEQELEKEIKSVAGRVKRAVKGFVTGSGDSIEELAGGITSDMIIYGDIRDLVKQGYYKISGKETDPLIVALSGIGLATEAADAVDWAPAVLKGFRKVGALSDEFAAFVMKAAKKSVKGQKMDGALKAAFGNLKRLTDKLGLSRTSTIFKHIDDPADLATIAKVAQKNADAAYFTIKNGGADGLDIIKRLKNSDTAVAQLATAAKKGPAGIQWLKRGGSGHKHVVRVRFGARLLKNYRLGRLQRLTAELAKQYPGLRQAFRACTILALITACLSFLAAIKNLCGKKTLAQADGNTQITSPDLHGNNSSQPTTTPDAKEDC